MKEIGIWIIGIIVAVVMVCALALDYSGLMWESFIGPRRENVRRNIYESTESFNEGKKQQLAKYFYEYNQADESGKIAVCTMVRQSFANYDVGKLPIAERSFVKICGGF